MASVWNPGTQVRIRAGVYSGHGGTVRNIHAEDISPIGVEIHGADTSIRSYQPDDLEVVR